MRRSEPSIEKFQSSVSSEVEATIYTDRLTNNQIMWLGQHLAYGREIWRPDGRRCLGIRPNIHEKKDNIVFVDNFMWLIRQNEIVYPLDDSVFRYLFHKPNSHTTAPPVRFPVKGYPISAEEFKTNIIPDIDSPFTPNPLFRRELWE
jgi:hypothetical protein